MGTTRGRYRISTDPRELDLDTVHQALAASYWSPGVLRATVERSLEGSLNFGLYEGTAQIGFARVVTDRATFAYLADVFVLEPHRGQGLATWLMETIMAHPDLQDLRTWLLLTRDAHGLYRKIGFEDLAPGRAMLRRGGRP